MTLEPWLRQRVSTAEVARLATVRPDGRPHLVPITFALEGDELVTVVDQKPKSTSRLQRLRNVEANPAVSILFDGYDEDWSRLWWARADGRARIVVSGPEHGAAVGALTRRYRQYRHDPPRGPALLVAIGRWTTWSSSGGQA